MLISLDFLLVVDYSITETVHPKKNGQFTQCRDVRRVVILNDVVFQISHFVKVEEVEKLRRLRLSQKRVCL